VSLGLDANDEPRGLLRQLHPVARVESDEIRHDDLIAASTSQWGPIVQKRSRGRQGREMGHVLSLDERLGPGQRLWSGFGWRQELESRSGVALELEPERQTEVQEMG
jgi:hypothetical protein